MANTSAIWQRAAHTTYQLSSPSCSTGVILKGLTPNTNLRFFCKNSEGWTIKSGTLVHMTPHHSSNPNPCMLSCPLWVRQL